MIYELRIYEAMPGKMRALNERFEDITLGYFQKHGINPVGFWTEEIGTNNALVYLLVFEDLVHWEKAWGAFRSDLERAEAFSVTERDGPLVAKITNRILRPTKYSPLQ